MEAADYILAGSPGRESAVAQDAATRVELKEIKISHIVMSMKDYIIGEDLIQQAKAIEYLTAVLGKLDPSFLSRQDVSLIVTYLSARIETAHVAGVKETALGLRALAAMNHFNPEDIIDICRKIFSSSDHFNENSAPARFEVYKLIDHFLKQYRYNVKSMEGEFVNGIISLGEREKDPRCLMVYFSILTVILAEWDIREQVKDLWDIVSRYYPITFRAKPDDPVGITPNELKLRLRMCIAATSEFAPMAFPFLIEKLDFQVTANVKKDVMETLSACAQHYGVQGVANWSTQVWDALKFEVLNASEDELADEALNTLQVMAEYLSYDGLTLQKLERTPLSRFVELVARECLKHLHEPQQRYARQSGQILGKVASGSPFAFHLVVKGVFSNLMAFIQDADSITKKREFLEVINKMLDARFELVQAQESSEFPSLAILDAVSESCAEGTVAHGGLTFFRDTLFETFALSLTNSPSQESPIRITAVKGLLKLVKLPGFLAPIEVGMIIQHLDTLILEKHDVGDDLKNEAVLALEDIVRLHEQSVLDICFPALLGSLPAVLTRDEDIKDCLPVLEALARIGSQGYAFATLSLRLRNKFENVIQKSNPQVYAHAILASLLYAVLRREAAIHHAVLDNDAISGYDQNSAVLVEALYLLITEVRLSTDGHNRIQGQPYSGLRSFNMRDGRTEPDETVVDIVGKIGMTVVRSMNVQHQRWAAAQIFTLFTESPSRQIDMEFVTQITNRTLTLSMYLVAGLHREIDLKFDPQGVCCMLIRHVGDFVGLIQGAQDSVLGLIALLFNKFVPAQSPSTKSETGSPPQELVLEILKTLDSKTANQVTNILRMSILFTMAANLKGARGTSDLLHILVVLLGSTRHGSELAKEFKYILAPSELLSKENFAVMRGPYKQRPYSICVPLIVNQFKASNDSSIKSNCLVALAGIFKYTPTEVLLPEIESLLPVILQSMDEFGSSVKAASIEVLRTAVIESPTSIEGHLRSIIHRLYDRIHNTLDDPSDAPSTVRVLALKCLGEIPRHLNITIALRYKTEVLRELEYALNDVKRNVRDEAVRCRFAWFNLAENTDDSD